MKKLALLLLVAILAVSGYIGAEKYTNHKEEIEEIKQNDRYNYNVERSKRMAIKHMKQKYGIDVDVVDTSGGDNITVLVSDGENEYKVFFSSDNYQAEEIENALFDMVKADIPTACEFEFTGDGMYYTYYDGDNLDEVLNDRDTLYVYCVNADFEGVSVLDFLHDNIYEYELYSFSSEEMLNNFIEETNKHTYRYMYIDDYIPFLDNYCKMSYLSDEYKIKKYNIYEYNDLICYQHDNIYKSDDINPETLFEEIHEAPFEWANDEYEFITGYSIKEDRYLYVWLPIPEDKKDREFYWAVEYSDYKDRKFEQTQKCRIVNGYVVTSFLPYYNQDVKFALMCK